MADPLRRTMRSLRVPVDYRPLERRVTAAEVAENRRRAWFELMARGSGVVPGPDARHGVGAFVCRVLPEDFTSPAALRDVAGLRRYDRLAEMFGELTMTEFDIEFPWRGEVVRMPVVVRGEERVARRVLEALKDRSRPVPVGLVPGWR